MGIYAKIRETASEATIFVVRNLVERLFGFLLIPIYTRAFDPHDYGILVLLLITEAFLSQVLQFGITTSYFRSYYDDDSDERRTVVTSTATWFLVGANGLFLFTALPFATTIGMLLFGEARPELVRLTLLITFLDTLNYLPFVVFKAQMRSRLFVAISWIATATQMSTIIYLVIGLSYGVEGALIGTLVGTGVKSVLYFSSLRRHIALRFSTSVLRPLLMLGIPVVFNSVATLVLKVSDRYFLRHYFDTSEVALYQLADQFAAIVPLLVANPFSLVWPAMRFKVMRDDDAQDYYARVLTYLSFLALYVGVGIAAMAPDVIEIVAHRSYYGATTVVPLFVISYVLSATAKGVNVGLMIDKRAHWNAIIVVVTACLNLALNFALIPRYGMYGAAVSTIASFAFMNWFRWYMSTRFYPVSYEWGRIAKLIAAAGIVYFAATLVTPESPIVSLIGRFSIAICYPLVVACTGFFDVKERSRILALLGTRWSRLLPRP
jgi:O-antigen/teichoic acid export membrane protein